MLGLGQGPSLLNLHPKKIRLRGLVLLLSNIAQHNLVKNIVFCECLTFTTFLSFEIKFDALIIISLNFEP